VEGDDQVSRRGPKVLGDDTTTAAFKCPKIVSDAINRAAAANFESPANYIRRVVVERLRAEGQLPAAPGFDEAKR
jgi:hypothetical protein